ncbi:hypothetical protein GCM10027091_70050 [Streptomyces daliensis]
MSFEPGSIVVDLSRCKVGTVTRNDGVSMTLVRPSGLEWEAFVSNVREANSTEQLSVRVHERNVSSAWGRRT